ncbi:hypothetical protein SLEP1_g22665 [Rubroshorea leprosula]|uniref:Uncharacterized protein n=1 Tax=Rubroshorea leprosula TaxID=152421 RepID=A0AAV5J9W2_9ROSI|nr:hypothetical protein SLEP1_g22665 [Rubroshorea leprosula]
MRLDRLMLKKNYMRDGTHHELRVGSNEASLVPTKLRWFQRWTGNWLLLEILPAIRNSVFGGCLSATDRNTTCIVICHPCIKCGHKLLMVTQAASSVGLQWDFQPLVSIKGLCHSDEDVIERGGVVSMEGGCQPHPWPPIREGVIPLTNNDPSCHTASSEGGLGCCYLPGIATPCTGDHQGTVGRYLMDFHC